MEVRYQVDRVAGFMARLEVGLCVFPYTSTSLRHAGTIFLVPGLLTWSGNWRHLSFSLAKTLETPFDCWCAFCWFPFWSCPVILRIGGVIVSK